MKRAKLPLLLSSFGELELVNAISLRLFRKEISASAGKASLGLLKNDVEAGILMIRPLTPAVFERAKQLARKRTPRLGTRSLIFCTLPRRSFCKPMAFTPSIHGKPGSPK